MTINQTIYSFTENPFVKNRYYTCIGADKRSDDTYFEMGKKYLCVDSYGKFSETLSKDDSHVKFKTDSGKIVSYFGSQALWEFSSNDNFILDYYRSKLDSKNIWIEDDFRKIQDTHEKLMRLVESYQSQLEEAEKLLKIIENHGNL
jgi:hypothetical protein